jgi:hypothetical protein
MYFFVHSKTWNR